jgi:hypothetical protein
MNPFKYLAINTWNRIVDARAPRLEGGLPLGTLVVDDKDTLRDYFLPTERRTVHIVLQGKSGGGKSFFIRHIAQHDIQAGRGFILFDLHGDLILPILWFLVGAGVPANRVVLIDPGSRHCAVGLNPLEATDEQNRFLIVAEVTRNLADRWGFRGARTEELLRNALFVLSANGLTILELALLLSNDEYRAKLLRKTANQDVRDYFQMRFDPLSEGMKATLREPVLNKVTEFIADVHFRYILGQRESTISFDGALANGQIILVNLNKGLLGLHAVTFGGLVLGAFTAAIFRRRNKELYTLFADEMQNLVSADTDFDILFSEARKFGIGIVTANQFAAQLPPKMRSAIQAVNTRIFFQLSPEDARHVADEIDGGKTLSETLRNLPVRRVVVKSGTYPAQHLRTPDVTTHRAPIDAFLNESNAIFARLREEIDKDILARRPKPDALAEVIDEWE